MTEAGRDPHVYLRSMARGERSSLSVLAGLVTAGSRVLDLGTGGGALGKHLREHAGCTVDGLTYNEREAELARPHYRRVVVADLENPGWPFEFPGEQYDFIVCADVLEHLRDPQKALACARQLLAPGGRLLVSIPNAGYCGLVAELLQGDFSYREEGLLDRTHLRFFTRRSLVRFLADEGWAVDTIESIDRPLNESEFKVAFERLPPAVARYLLAVPDAAAYQFVVAARPGPASRVDADPPAQDQAAALFSAQLYVGDENGFREDNKVVVPGTVGAARQLLRFHIPSGATVGRLRLDPADRPGFLYLHGIRLLAGDAPVWQWRSDLDGLEALAAAPHHDMMLRSPWPGSAALVLLHGDDPSIELPVPATALAACGACAQAVLEVELGWPMSADYMALVELVVPLQQRIESMRVQAQHDHAQQAQRLEAARAEANEARQAAADAQAAAEQLATRQNDLDLQNQSLREDKNALVRERLRLQAERDSLAEQFRALADHLRWIENSTVFRATRPLVHAKMAVERMLGLRGPEAPAPLHVPQPMEPAGDTVDVIVPVYRGLHDTQLCIRSVLASSCRTPWRLVILNDASPEPEVTQWLREVSQTDPRIVLLENERNLGFVATVNRGMALGDHDVLLLNSDTEVANDWLDRLRHAAYSNQRVASVTPFSNNATICSYPRFCEPNELPPGWDTRSLDALFAS
ncbi:MAG: methyltransferase domain-containing protein, partial [Ramlibacter sp.]|nr:methyltransferase domain-containing protein [Ramlibacter sp.]